MTAPRCPRDGTVLVGVAAARSMRGRVAVCPNCERVYDPSGPEPVLTGTPPKYPQRAGKSFWSPTWWAEQARERSDR